MISKIRYIVICLTLSLGFLSCQKQEDPKPAITPNKVPFRVAKSLNTTGLSNTTDGFSSYVITTSEGFTYTLTFQEVNGYTTFNVTRPGGTSGACKDRIIVLLDKWIDESQDLYYNQDNACSVVQTFVSDFRSVRDCVPAETRSDFEEASDKVGESVDEFCQ